MSDEEYEFKKGLERGKAGRSSAYGLLDTDLGDSSAAKNARRRGWEAGSSMHAATEVLHDRLEVRSTNYPDEDEDDDRHEKSGNSNESFPWALAIAYCVIAAGAYFLMGKVATWSLVWWICLLVLLAGIPLWWTLAVVLFVGWLYLMGIFIALAILVGLVQYFSSNFY